ncbi:peptidyl-prolyl cis-trans isomerase [Aureococcus anophagefferens]|nr:peptidyl-prolyl cis-trans isomerase [Aureococcus anophagefferens]
MGKVVGFDVGGESTMVVDDSGVIVRNELGGHSSSSLVGFSGMERYVGEAAVAQLSTNAKNTARIGERLSGNGALDAHRPGAGEAAFTVSGYAGEETTSFGDDALCCALLRRCGSLAAASLGPSCREGAADLRGAFAVPTCWGAEQRAALRSGAAAPCAVRGVDLDRSAAAAARRRERLRKLLSTMETAKTTAENMGDERDVPLEFSRDELRETCASVLESFKGLLEKALANAAVDKVDAVELVGGGSRVAVAQEVAKEVFGVDADLADAKAKLEEERKARQRAAAGGRGEAGGDAAPKAEDSVVQADDAAALAALRTAEDAMVARDDGVKAVADKRNALETKILELRSAKSGKHYKLFEEKSSDFGALLDDAEEWLWSDEAYAATAEVMQAKLDEMSAKAQDMVPAYFETIEKERLDMEKQLEAEAAAAAANDDDDDEAREDRLHADTRKLKFGDRFRLVEKNKKEGTELFKDGNITHAAKRCKDALGHAAKFRDLNPEQTAQTTKIKVDLHVNMALCWTKLDNVDQALKSAEEALKLEPAHPKALYRRAAAFEKTSKFDEAKKDLNAVLKQNPEDKAALAFAKRVDAQLARQKAKAKKMASKMFA